MGGFGAEVIRQNHLGDWGTQFGMLSQYLDEHPEATWHHDELAGNTSAVSALDELYKAARRAFDADPAFADRSRARVVALQASEPTTVARWKEIVIESERALSCSSRETRSASPSTTTCSPTPSPISSTQGSLSRAQRRCDLLPGGYRSRRQPRPAHGVQTRRRLRQRRLLYVTDSRQALHFRLIFEAPRRAGWLTEAIDAEHIATAPCSAQTGAPSRPAPAASMVGWLCCCPGSTGAGASAGSGPPQAVAARAAPATRIASHAG